MISSIGGAECVGRVKHVGGIVPSIAAERVGDMEHASMPERIGEGKFAGVVNVE